MNPRRAFVFPGFGFPAARFVSASGDVCVAGGESYTDHELMSGRVDIWGKRVLGQARRTHERSRRAHRQEGPCMSDGPWAGGHMWIREGITAREHTWTREGT